MNYNKASERLLSPILEWAKASKKTAESSKAMIMSVDGSREIDRTPLKFNVPDEFSGKDYITMLLHIDAEIEHGLMLQYLYAAYSIGGNQIPEAHREKVYNWQNIILGIAKEEMGHFISVQNVLKVIGAPLNFGRESYPWDTPFYPFPFTLERFTLSSLSKYIYAEAPAKWLESDDPIAAKVKKAVDAKVADPHTVGALFTILLQLINDPDVISDETFQAATYPYQGSFNEWGRSYVGGERGSAGNNVFSNSPDVLVAQLLSRDDAYNALAEISEQGEGQETVKTIPSHFERFLFVYNEYQALLEDLGDDFEPSRNVATNPYAGSKTSNTKKAASIDPSIEIDDNRITNPEAILWANLFDIRYRLLLNFLNHSFLLDNGSTNSGGFSPRGMIINSTFGEMYNLRSISAILVQTPLHPPLLGSLNPKMAGPTFTMPYSIDLPFGEPNRWRLHFDLLDASSNIIESLQKIKTQPNIQYLNGLKEADKKLMQTCLKIIEK